MVWHDIGLAVGELMPNLHSCWFVNSGDSLESLTKDDLERWKKYAAEGKSLAGNGKMTESLQMLQKASEICMTDKLQKNINKLEVGRY